MRMPFYAVPPLKQFPLLAYALTQIAERLVASGLDDFRLCVARQGQTIEQWWDECCKANAVELCAVPYELLGMAAPDDDRARRAGMN